MPATALPHPVRAAAMAPDFLPVDAADDRLHLGLGPGPVAPGVVAPGVVAPGVVAPGLVALGLALEGDPHARAA